jgi:peptidoglycan-associated lipoprotein
MDAMDAKDLLRALALGAASVVASTSCASSEQAARPPSTTTTTTRATITTTNAPDLGAIERPPPEPPPKPSDGIFIGDRIKQQCTLPSAEEAPHFEFDSATLTPEGQSVLRNLASCLTVGPLRGAPLTVIGHADPRGAADHNERLALERARAVKAFLVSYGISGPYIAVESRGEKDATGTNAAGWARDRRVEIWPSERAPKE